jgi:hypothetical protein
MEESIALPHALQVIEKTKAQIEDIEELLPASKNPNFRQRVVSQLETEDDPGFRQEVEKLLRMYENVFGVDDVLE